MKKILILGFLLFAYMQISLAQLRVDANSQLHIGGTSPTERLDVNGAIRIGTTSNTNAGTIRYLSNVFEGYNGTDWIDLTGNYNALDSVSILFSGFGKTHIATENIQLGAFYLSGDGGNEGVFIDGSGNVGIGENAPSAKLDINGEVLINGIDIGKGDNELSDNTVFGVLAGTAITTGNYNTFIGKNTGIANTTGEKNTFFGRQAGYSNITGSDNIFIGHQAGYNETGSDKLYIDNSSTSTPLIGGDFATDEITVNGDLIVKSGEGISLPTAGNGIGFGSSDLSNETWKMEWGGNRELSYYRNDTNKVAGWVGVSTQGARFAMYQFSFRGTADNNPAYSFLQDGDTGLVRYDVDEIGLVTGGVTRLICMADGDTGIGTDAPSEKLDVNGNARFRSIGSGTSSGALHYESDGTLTTNTSDIRLKKNITRIKSPIKKVQRLRGVKYSWKDSNDASRQIGLIAQEVEKVVPELVFTNPVDGYKGVHYDKVVALLIEAMKGQQIQIEALQKEVKRLLKKSR